MHCLVSGATGYDTLSRRNHIVETVGKELGTMMPWRPPSSVRQPVFGGRPVVEDITHRK